MRIRAPLVRIDHSINKAFRRSGRASKMIKVRTTI
jgi:hypothetical protein